MTLKLTQKQSRALPLLVRGESGASVAKQIGVKPSTVSLWINHDARFQDALEMERQEALKEAKNALVGGVISAAQEVARLARSAESETVRLQAAKYLLDRLIVLSAPSEERELSEAMALLRSLYGNSS